MKLKFTFLLSILIFWQVPNLALNPHSPAKNLSLTCNTVLNLSLDLNCEALISPDILLENIEFPINEYVIEITDNLNNQLTNPINGTVINQTVTATITHTPTDNACSTQITIEDNLAPNITCFNNIIQCFENSTNALSPIAFDNCDGNLIPILVNETIDQTNLCDGVTISKTYIAIDENGNQSSPCTQVITTETPNDPLFPDNTIWSCAIYAGNTNLIEPEFSGHPNVAEGVYCPFNINYSDINIPGCGNTFTIIRTWTVLNWCTGQVFVSDINGNTNIQIIQVLDNEAPNISRTPFEIEINVASNNLNPCNAQNLIPPAIIADDCHDWTVEIFTPIGEATYFTNDGSLGGIVPPPGLAFGDHQIIYKATDECGNVAELSVLATVVDNTAPNAICDEITSISISSDGFANTPAETFDDGSFDNCCLEDFLAKRDSENSFTESINFDCTDIENSPVSVIFRAVDCFGGFNDCEVSVILEDNSPPFLVFCPIDLTITCDSYVDELETALTTGNNSILNDFGFPIFQDNCSLIPNDSNIIINLNNCKEGAIIRNWSVSDIGNNGTVNCAQTIFVEHISDWVVEFPADQLVNCGETLPNTGAPILFYESCELIAISSIDTYFEVVSDACFKIVRDWTVINWCTIASPIEDIWFEDSELTLNLDLNEDNELSERIFKDGLNLNGAQPDGIITYQQTIKINDTVPPVVTCPLLEDLQFCIFDNSCTASVILPAPQVIDCSEELTYEASSLLGDGFGPFENTVAGIYPIVYSVSDNCGNQSVCSTNILVQDCKNPTALCLSGLIIELDEFGEASLSPEMVNAGSYDNCSGDLDLSFSPNILDNSIAFDCLDLGEESFVQLWVTDASGNQDFCELLMTLQNNNAACIENPLIGGHIETPLDLPVLGVTIAAAGASNSSTETDSNGDYLFENLEENGNYSIIPEKNTLPLNGVTTFDIVIISKHILGSQLLDSPYKIIAADVNGSNSVSTIDLVHIRRLILFINEEFPNSTPSWRFIDKTHIFTDPTNPFLDELPELFDLVNLTIENLSIDFTGIKIGDVNNSVNPNNLLGIDDRSIENTTFLSTDNQIFIKNKIVEIPIKFDVTNIEGFQFALEFDIHKLAFLEIENGLTHSDNFGFSKLQKGLIFVSWNGNPSQNQTLFTLKFRGLETGDLLKNIQLNTKILSPECYTSNLGASNIDISNLDLLINPINPALSVESYPNPFSNKLTIQIHSQQDASINFSLQNIAGKTIAQNAQQLKKGLNNWTINNLNQFPKGVYFYKVEGNGYHQSGKIIKI